LQQPSNSHFIPSVKRIHFRLALGHHLLFWKECFHTLKVRETADSTDLNRADDAGLTKSLSTPQPRAAEFKIMFSKFLLFFFFFF
jgi:hypothetical protein